MGVMASGETEKEIAELEKIVAKQQEDIAYMAKVITKLSDEVSKTKTPASRLVVIVSMFACTALNYLVPYIMPKLVERLFGL